MGDLRLRAAKLSDAPTLADTMHRSVHGLTQGQYTEAQRRAWSPSPMPPQKMRARLRDGRQVWVAERFGTVLGFVELEANGHIDCCYVAPEAVRQGVASALYTRLEQAARDQAIPQLFVEASDTALAFFKSKGFQAEARQSVMRAGVTLHNTRMVKPL